MRFLSRLNALSLRLDAVRPAVPALTDAERERRIEEILEAGEGPEADEVVGGMTNRERATRVRAILDEAEARLTEERSW